MRIRRFTPAQDDEREGIDAARYWGVRESEEGLRHADAVRTQGMRQLMSVLIKYAPPSHLLSLCGLFFLSLPTHTPILNNFPLLSCSSFPAIPPFLSLLPKELGRQERRGQSSTSSNEGLLCETPSCYCW